MDLDTIELLYSITPMHGENRMIPQRFLLLAAAILGIFQLSAVVQAQEESPVIRPKLEKIDEKALINDVDVKKTAQGSVLDARSQKFQKLMSGAKLTGLFTIEGKPLKDQNEETYEIRKVEKSKAEGDEWIITARVKYGKNDYEMPFPIQVKWAGDTPVLTLEKLAVPGMGVFSARVVLHGTKYAGTWQHDEVGGHLFGKIQLAESTKSPETK
jgi:hypothetical protein